MDEFLDWLMEVYLDGELTQEDIELGCIDHYFAYEMFIDSCRESKQETGLMAMETFRKARSKIEKLNEKSKHGKPNF